jgi:outer membrane protein TolC
LPETVIPQNSWENEVAIQNFQTDLNDLLGVASTSHPELQLYDFKLDALQIEKRLKFQSLLPKADFTYNHLNKGYNVMSNEFSGLFFNNNYRYGLNFELPLRLSEGRGEYRKAKLKIKETSLNLSQKQLAIQIKIRSYHNEFTTLQTQLAIQNANFLSYQQLVRAEEIRFKNGESSLFLINSRESKALEAQEKLVEIKTKLFKTIYALQWSAGLLAL